MSRGGVDVGHVIGEQEDNVDAGQHEGNMVGAVARAKVNGAQFETNVSPPSPLPAPPFF